MAYTAEISGNSPTCFLFLIDQSGSMGRAFAGQPDRTLAQGVADAINRLLRNLVRACSNGEIIFDRYAIGVIGYGDEISLGFSGNLAGGCLRWVSEIKNHPLRSEQVSHFPVWFEPLAYGKTVMCQALSMAQEVIAGFIQAHPRCFPPVVINITDGEATDGDPEPLAAALCSLASTDGGTLLLNIHITPDGVQPVLLPASVGMLAAPYAQRLFRMSSLLPPPLLRQAQIHEQSVADGARGFVFNADLEKLAATLGPNWNVQFSPVPPQRADSARGTCRPCPLLSSQGGRGEPTRAGRQRINGTGNCGLLSPSAEFRASSDRPGSRFQRPGIRVRGGCVGATP